MNWQNRILFHVRSKGGLVSRKTIEPLLMSGCNSYEDSKERLKHLIKEGYLQRIENDNFSFELTEKGAIEIDSLYFSTKLIMEEVNKRLERLLANYKSINFSGSITGSYFTFTNSTMFRFHPNFITDEEVVLFVRLPNLLSGSSEYSFNKIYITRDVLLETTFLEDIVLTHLKMIDRSIDQNLS